MNKKKLILLLIGLVCLAAFVLVNVLFGLLPVSSTRLDATQGNLLTPSEALTQAAQAVDTPVTIYYVSAQENIDPLLETLVNDVSRQNDNITVKQLITGTAGDDIVSRYASDGLSDNSLIVTSDLRSYVIENEELISVVYNETYLYYYNQYVVDSQEYFADSLLAFALDYTTRQDVPVLYQLTGHGETALGATASELLARRYVEVRNLSLLQEGTVPEDAQALIINGPTADISAAESEALLAYLQAGGKLLLMTSYDKAELSNLSKVTEYYGMQAQGGLVQDPKVGYHYSDSSAAYNYYIRPDVAQTGALAELAADEALSLCIPQSHALTLSAVTRDTLTVETLMTTSEEAYLKSNLTQMTTLDQEDGDVVGVFDLAMTASEGDTRLVWLANIQALSDNSIGLSSYNGQMFTSLLAWMQVQMPEEQQLTGVNLLLNALEAGSANAPVIKGLFIALPVFMLLIGLIACRKEKKPSR